MRKGAWKDRASDGLLEIHATAELLRSATGRSTLSKLQDLDMRIQGSRTPKQVVMRMPNGVHR